MTSVRACGYVTLTHRSTVVLPDACAPQKFQWGYVQCMLLEILQCHSPEA